MKSFGRILSFICICIVFFFFVWLILSNASLQQTYTYVALTGTDIKVSANIIKRIVRLMYIIEHRNYVIVNILYYLLCFEAFFFFCSLWYDILSRFTCTAWEEKDIFCYPNWDINLWCLQQEGQAACNLACSEVGESEDVMCVFQ